MNNLYNSKAKQHIRSTKLALDGHLPALEPRCLPVTGAGRTVVVGAICLGTFTARGLELIEEQIGSAMATCTPVVVAL